MRSPSIRHTVLLHLTLVGAYPEIRRDVAVDRDLTLAELQCVVRAVFDGPSCGHHLFTDSIGGPRWSRERRRWGDKWTMIDFRDPTVIDETTARVGSVLRAEQPIYFAHTCDGEWVVEIEAGPDDLVAASDPRVRVVSGERHSPFACTRSPYEHDVLVSVLGDPGHPDHEALRARIELTVGPWARFDPDVVDLGTVQRVLDTHNSGAALPSSRAPLTALMRALPSTARAGLRAHLSAAGLELPVVVTVDEAASMTRELRWLISRGSDGGIPFLEGAIDAESLRAGVEALGCDEDRIRRLVAASRQLRLVYSRNGRLVVKKRVSAMLGSPAALWAYLADAISLANRTGTLAASDLFLLAIADGSLIDPDIGLSKAATAFRLADEWQGNSWSHSWTRDEDPDCGQHCDCPTVGGATWHDIVAKSIRDAAQSAGTDGAVTVAAYADHHEAGIPAEWIAEETMRTHLVGTRPYRSYDKLDAVATYGATSELLSEVAGLVEVLSLFGLARSDDGAWIVPPTLREFAHAALQRRGGYADF